MKKKDRAKPALDLLEEAVHLLRMAPASVILPYYVGSLPFILGLLYFLADMSRGAFAADHVFESSFVLTLLFFWMKAWQTVFASRLKSRVGSRDPFDLTFRRFARIVVTQVILQPLGLLLIPVSLVLAFPAAWVYALFQNITVLGDGDLTDTGALVMRSWTQAKLWAGQNHVVLTFLSLIGVVVMLDLAAVLLMMPELLKTLFGVETVFSISGYAVMNTTFLGVICGISYLCLDPLVKATYVLRCFYGESMRTGEDLRSEMKRLAAESSKRIAGVVILVLLASACSPIFAESASAQKLDTSINKVIRKPEYQWRLPREKDQAQDEGVISKYLEKMFQYTIDAARWVQRMWERLNQWLRDLLPRPRGDTEEPGPPGKIQLRLILILTGVVLVILGIVLWRIRKNRKQTQPVEAVPMAAVPNLADEDVGADLLPEEGWQALARDLFERGELRLAVRALYLGALAFLADRDMISIARFKSNRDYLNEIRRRAHDRVTLQNVFLENIGLFEQSWYGRHQVTGEDFAHFNQNTERIKSLAQE